MANVVDELVVVLGLDASAFTEGQKRALESFKKTRDDATTTAKELEARGKQGGMFFGEINRQAVGLIATLVGAGSLEKYLAGAVPQIAALGRVAFLMGQSAPDLKAFQLFVQQTGGNADVATSSFLKLSQVMQNFKTGLQLPDLPFMQGLSFINQTPNSGAEITNQSTPIEVFEKYAAWTRGQTGQRDLQVGTQLGFDTDTINAAIRAGPNAAADLAAQRKNVPSDADVKRVQDLQIAFNNLRQAILGDANAMLFQASPALTGLLNLVTLGTTKFPGLTKVVLGLLTALTALGGVKIAGGLLRGVLGLGGGAAAAEGGAAVAGGVGIGTLAGAAPGAALQIGIFAAENAAGRWVGNAIGGALQGQGAKPGPVAAIAHAVGLPAHEVAAIAGGFGHTLSAREANIRDALASALGISKDAAAGIVSNLVAESGLVSGINEKKPTKKGSLGGEGWEQWTGFTKGNHRRADFEAWAKANGLDPKSDEANFGMVVQDLLNNPAILAQIKGAQNPNEAAADFFKLVSGNNPALQIHKLGHERYARGIAGLGSEGGNTYNFGDIIVNGVQDPRAMARHVTKAISTNIATQANSGPH